MQANASGIPLWALLFAWFLALAAPFVPGTQAAFVALGAEPTPDSHGFEGLGALLTAGVVLLAWLPVAITLLILHVRSAPSPRARIFLLAVAILDIGLALFVLASVTEPYDMWSASTMSFATAGVLAAIGSAFCIGMATRMPRAKAA